MKNKALQRVSIIIMILILVIAVPLITVRFSDKLTFITDAGWNILGYYSALLGGGATLLAVVFTNRQSKKELLYSLESNKKSERLNEIKVTFGKSFSELDVTWISAFYPDIKNLNSSLSLLTTKNTALRQNMNLEILFSQKEKKIIGDKTFFRISSYATTMSDLLRQLANEYSKLQEYNICKSEKELLANLQQSANPNPEEIEKLIYSINSLSHITPEAIVAKTTELRRAIITLYNEQYSQITTEIMDGVNSLEEYHHSQLKSII